MQNKTRDTEVSLNFLIGNGTYVGGTILGFYTDFETIILSICLVLLVENIEILVTFLLLLFLLAIGI